MPETPRISASRTGRAVARWTLILALVSGMAPVSASAVMRREPPPSAGPSAILDLPAEDTRVLVKFKPETTPEQVRAYGQVQGYRVHSEMPQIGWTVLEPDGTDSAVVAARIRAAGLAGRVEFDVQAKLAVVPDDPHYPDLWGLENTGQDEGLIDADIDAETAWDVSTGSSDIVVAVVDSGADMSHPDLAENAWHNPGEIPDNGLDDDANGYIDDYYGWDFANDDKTTWDLEDDDRHGTHVSGTIGAVGDNAIGVAGVNWDVSIMSCKFLTATSASVADGADGILYAVDNGADVINHSWSTATFSGILADAVNYARDHGVINVCAAANDGRDLAQYPEWPASLECTSVVTVASVDRDDELSSFSNYSEPIVDIAAPGREITSTIPIYPSALYIDDAPFEVAYFGFPVESIEATSARQGMIGGAMDRLAIDTDEPILIVDDSYPDMAGEVVGARSSAYVDALVAAGYSDIDVYDIEDEFGNRPSAATMNAHTVVWFTGRMGVWNYTRGSLDSDDRSLIGTYLDGGGRLLLAGGDIGADLDYFGGSPSWYEDYLHAECVDYESWTPDVLGTPGTSLDGFAGTIPIEDFDEIDWPSGSDVFLAADGGATSLVDWSAYAPSNGTSMATPHVTGAIALAMAAYPGSSAADAWTRIRNSVDILDSLDGSVARAGRMNLGDALGDYPAPPTVDSPAKGDVLTQGLPETLTFTPHSDAASGTTYEIQVGTPTDYVTNAGFEQGSLAGWVTGGDSDWLATQDVDEVRTGLWGARSGPITDDEVSSIERSLAVPTSGAWVTFDYWLDSEDGYDYAEAYVGASRRWLIANDKGWSPARMWLTSGNKTVTWYYGKDSSVTEGRDAFGLDNVHVSTYAWSEPSAVSPGSTEITFTVPVKTSDNGAVRIRSLLGDKTSEWVDMAGLVYEEDTSPPLGPVTDLVAVRDGSNVELTWTSPTSAKLAGVRVLARDGTPPVSATDPLAETLFDGLGDQVTDPGVFAPDTETTRYYAAYAYDHALAYTDPATTSILVDTKPPAAPTALAAAVDGDGGVALGWIDPADGDLDYTRIVRTFDDPATGPEDGTTIYEGTGQAAADSGLSDGALVHYAAYARDGVGHWSVPDTTSVIAADSAPDPVTDLAAVRSGDDVALSWTNPTSPDFVGMVVIARNDLPPTSVVDPLATEVYRGSAEATVDVGVFAPDTQTTRYYAAYSYDSEPAYAASATVSILVDTRPPAAPTALAVTFDDDRNAALTWLDPGDADFDYTRVVRTFDAPPTGPDDGTTLYEGTGQAAPDVGLPEGALVHYAAYARDAVGHWSVPDRASIVVDTIPPSGTFKIASGDYYTPSRTVSLDSDVTGATEMRIDPGSGSYGAWEPYVATTSRTLAVSEGEATVRVQYRDARPNTLVLTDDIVVDIGAPHDDRLAGSNRYSTAIDISKNSFAAGSVGTVVLATGEDYADALGASALAGAYRAPVLLTKRDSLPSGLLGTSGELARLGAKNVVIIGGTAAVSAEVEAQLDKAGYLTPRLFGKDRYATAAAVAERTLSVRGDSPIADTVFIARGDEYADALSVAPIAYATRAPVLLVKPTSVPSATRNAIAAGGFSQAEVIGGTSAISPAVAGELGVTYYRIDGSNRYETAAKLAIWADSQGLVSFDYVGVATGTGFADALGGGAGIGAQGGVVLLTKPTSVSGYTSATIKSRAEKIRSLWILGGPAAISDTTKAELTGLLPN